eukprot:scaffold19786_cov92-Skeletonema_dohrnii-CCMP3373.AAC.1
MSSRNEEVEGRGNDSGHPQPHYYHRYNHFPQRSSFSYSSSNLSSYNKNSNGLPLSASQGVPHKSSSTVASTSSSSPQHSSSSLSHQEDDFSVIEESSTSAISLYEVFAAGVVSSKRSLQNTQLDKRSDISSSSSSLPCGSNSDATSLSMNNDDMISSS